MRLLPLSEIIAAVLKVDDPSTQAVWKIYNLLVAKFEDEYKVLIDASEAALKEVVEAQVAEAILRVRAGSIVIVPGFDGVYGKLVLDNVAGDVPAKIFPRGRVQQLNLGDFW